MQKEYTGKPIFKYRYIGMGEDAVRDEIDRLQGELYAVEEALDYFDNDYKAVKQDIIASQQKNERILHGMDDKLIRLQRSLDYEAPIKTQLDTLTNGINEKIDSSNKKGNSKIVRLILINTVLNVILTILVVCSLIFF